MSADTLSEVLRAVRLEGAVFFSVTAADHWVAEAPPAAELASYVMPGSEHVIEYHVVVSGSCYGGLIDGPTLRLEAGDVIVFPKGDAHVMGSAPNMRGNPAWDFEPGQTTSLPIRVHLGPGSEPQVHVICGFLGCDAGPFNPLLESLPRVLHVRARERGARIEQLVQLALSESLMRVSGSQCVLSRVSELLFIEVVRQYIATLPEGQTGWLAGLRDPFVGRCLSRLHGAPAQPWTLDELARQVGTSRSVLAERFAHFVGVPPMQYLARWRMQVASGLLSLGNKNMAQIAADVGYGSEAAFSRAFKREMGVPPTAVRRGSARSEPR